MAQDGKDPLGQGPQIRSFRLPSGQGQSAALNRHPGLKHGGTGSSDGSTLRAAPDRRTHILFREVLYGTEQ